MNADVFLKQLNAVLDEFKTYRATTKYGDDISDIPENDRQGLVSKAVAAITRVSGSESTYAREVQRILKSEPVLHLHSARVIGVVKALRDDLEAGFIRSLVELVHSELFSDFLEMAEHLCDSAYKDAAAVIAGSTLEGHLRGLCKKTGISTEVTKADGGIVPKNAEAMNSELAKAEVYSKIDQKSVTAWLGLRNKAAHGEYDKYGKEQVALLITGARDFIARNPA